MPIPIQALGTALTAGSSLVSPFMDAFGDDKGGYNFLKTLEDLKIKNPEIMKKLMDRAEMLADKRELSKGKIAGSMTAKGLEGSIIGDQAGLELDKADNKALLMTANELDQNQATTNRAIDTEIANFKLGQAGARRQGRADFFGGLAGNLGKLFAGGGAGQNALFNWLNKPRQGS